MADLTCVDGRVLRLRPVPVLGRDGVPYETVLELDLDGAPWGVVGERCRGVLAALHERGLVSSSEARVRAAGLDWDAVAPYVSRDRELLALRSRDPDDLPGEASVRALLDVRRVWGRDGWQVTRQVRLEAWGDTGGVLAVLEPAAAVALVGQLLDEAEVAATSSTGR